jgi:hypothetical protein
MPSSQSLLKVAHVIIVASGIIFLMSLFCCFRSFHQEKQAGFYSMEIKCYTSSSIIINPIQSD